MAEATIHWEDPATGDSWPITVRGENEPADPDASWPGGWDVQDIFLPPGFPHDEAWVLRELIDEIEEALAAVE